MGLIGTNCNASGFPDRLYISLIAILETSLDIKKKENWHSLESFQEICKEWCNVFKNKTLTRLSCSFHFMSLNSELGNVAFKDSEICFLKGALRSAAGYNTVIVKRGGGSIIFYFFLHANWICANVLSGSIKWWEYKRKVCSCTLFFSMLKYSCAEVYWHFIIVHIFHNTPAFIFISVRSAAALLHLPFAESHIFIHTFLSNMLKSVISSD